MEELKQALAKARADELAKELPPGMRKLLQTLGSNGRGISKAELRQQVARRRAQVAAAKAAVPTKSTKSPKKPKPKKAGKKPAKEKSMSTRSIKAILRSFDAPPKKRKSEAVDPRLVASLIDATGFEPSAELREACANAKDADDTRKILRMAGATSVADLYAKRDTARAAARGGAA